MSYRKVNPLVVGKIPKRIIVISEWAKHQLRSTLDVPSIFGSSRFFRVPAPTFGNPDAKTMILPPMWDYNECQKGHSSFVDLGHTIILKPA